MATKYRVTVIRKLIIEVFNDEELEQFCADHFAEAKSQFGSGMSLEDKVYRLIGYFDRRGALKSLLDKIKEARSEKYAEYEEKLTKVDEVQSDLDDIRAGQSKYEDAYEALSGAEATQRHIPRKARADSKHPLAGNAKTVRDWFAHLNTDEQIFVMTVALFNSLEKHELMAIYHQLQLILRPEVVPQASTSVSSGKENPEADRVVHLKISLDNPSVRAEIHPESTSPNSKSDFIDEAHLLEVANLTTIEGKRNMAHGSTLVRLIDFRTEEQRQKVIRLLADSYSQLVRQLVPFLILLGTDAQAVIRQRAAETVGELMREFDFNRYANDVLRVWAGSDNLFMNLSVGLALVGVAKDERYVDNVKAMLKHWATSDNRNFNLTSISSCVAVGAFWPAYTCELIEAILKQEWLDLLIWSVFVVRQLDKEGHMLVVVENLANWVTNPRASLSLRRGATLIFLEVVNLSHVASNGQLMDYAVQIIMVGLSERKLTQGAVLRSAMLDKLKDWATSKVGKGEQAETLHTLLTRLLLNAETPRDKERLQFYLQKWSKENKDLNQFVS